MKLQSRWTLLLVAFAMGFALAACIASLAMALPLTTKFTMPTFEPGPNGCDEGTIDPETDLLSVSRIWTGTSAGQDSLIGLQPGQSAELTSQVPQGAYSVTIRLRDPARNWSCPVTIAQSTRARVAKAKNVGMLTPGQIEALAWIAVRGTR